MLCCKFCTVMHVLARAFYRPLPLSHKITRPTTVLSLQRSLPVHRIFFPLNVHSVILHAVIAMNRFYVCLCVCGWVGAGVGVRVWVCGRGSHGAGVVSHRQ